MDARPFLKQNEEYAQVVSILCSSFKNNSYSTGMKITSKTLKRLMVLL